MTTPGDRRQRPRPLPLDDRTAVEVYEDQVWAVVRADRAAKAAAKAVRQ